MTEPAESSPAAAPSAAGDVAALMMLLAWMRAEGYGCQTLTVGTVQVVAVRDYFPSQLAQHNAAAAADKEARASVSVGGAYEQFGADLPGYDDVVRGAQ